MCIVGKTYVIFVGHKPGVYNICEETYGQVDKFSKASHKSFLSRDEALNAFHAFMEEQHPTAPLTIDKESSCKTFIATSIKKPTQVEKLAKLKDLFLDLENKNCNHVLRIIGITEEITQQIRYLEN